MVEFHSVSRVDEGLPPGLIEARAEFVRITGMCRTELKTLRALDSLWSSWYILLDKVLESP